MATLRSKSLLLSTALISLSAMLHTSVVDAGVVCNSSTLTCTVTSAWLNNVAVRVTVGTDQNGVLRYVMSPVNNPSDVGTQPMSSKDYLWIFTGSDAGDVMVEVPRIGISMIHGPYTLTAPSGLTQGIMFRTFKGNDIAVGGNFTTDITSHNEYSFRGGISTRRDPNDFGVKTYILFPNASGDPGRSSASRSVRVLWGGNYLSTLIVAPTLAGSELQRIYIAGDDTVGAIDYMCNLNNQSIQLISGSKLDGDKRYGSALTVIGGMAPDVSIGNYCWKTYDAVIKQVTAPVQ